MSRVRLGVLALALGIPCCAAEYGVDEREGADAGNPDASADDASPAITTEGGADAADAGPYCATRRSAPFVFCADFDDDGGLPFGDTFTTQGSSLQTTTVAFTSPPRGMRVMLAPPSLAGASPSAFGIHPVGEKTRYTVAASVRIERAPGNGARLFSLRGIVPGTTDLEAEVAVQLETGGAVTVPIYGESSYTVGTTTASLVVGKWYRVELRLELSVGESITWFLRIDGAQVGTGAFQPFPAGFDPGSGTLYVGASDLSTSGPAVEVYYDDVSVEAP